MKDIEAVATPWREVVLVCGKCGKKLDGGFGRKQRDKLRTTLKAALKEAGRRRSVRLAETGCLGLCPKNAVSLLRAGRPETLLAIPAGTAMAELLERLDLAAPPAGRQADERSAAQPRLLGLPHREQL